LKSKVKIMLPRETHLSQLSEIKRIMNRSTRFESISGYTGIFAGLFALIGAYVAWGLLYDYQNYMTRSVIHYVPYQTILYLLLDGTFVFTATLATAIYLTHRKARLDSRSLWDASARRLMVNLLIPIGVGGLFLMALLLKGYVGLIAPGMLIFYGLALINASKYTFSHFRYLGFMEVFIGLLATVWMGYGLIFWSIGFGVIHVLYGFMMLVLEKQ
jgi:hypothetical protein